MVLIRKWIFPLLLLPLMLLSSCNILEPGLSVLRGNYLYQQGRYQDALLFYLHGEDSGKFEGRIQYNMGNVYYALGEGPAALELWTIIDGNTDLEVTYNTIFNQGVIYYQMGNYPEAYRSFRTALELRSGSLDAKRNLEMTIDRLEAEARSGETRSESPTLETTDDARRILQYIRRKEGNPWKSEQNNPASVNDW